MTLARRCTLLAALLLAARAAVAAPLDVTSDDADGIIDVGQRVTWTVQAEPGVTDATYTLRRGGLTELSAGTLTFVDGAATVAGQLDEPGALLLDVKATDATGKTVRSLGGAIAAPDRVRPSSERPADFEAFWNARLAELAAVPINAQETPADPAARGVPTGATTAPASTTRPDVAYSLVTLDNIRGTHVRGQLARPRAGEKFPAVLIVQWAGVYPLWPNYVTDRAAEGWLALNINAHDLPIDEPAKFYEDLSTGALRGYAAIGNDDRDTSYFLRMYLGVARAIDYLRSRPDWDGRTLLVTGSSQGGQQTLIAAALRPDITAAIANVPAGCDMWGPDLGRLPGWPRWITAVGTRSRERVREAARYYDVVNFTPLIRCPTLVGLGLIDETCSPEGIYVAFNGITAPKEVVAMPRSTHGGPFQAYLDRATTWRTALLAGEPVPPAAAAR